MKHTTIRHMDSRRTQYLLVGTTIYTRSWNRWEGYYQRWTIEATTDAQIAKKHYIHVLDVRTQKEVAKIWSMLCSTQGDSEWKICQRCK